MALLDKVLSIDTTRTVSGRHGAFDIVATWPGSAIRYLMTLARFSSGRILLHLIAMLGDRCVRFHAAGIMRELPWIAARLTLLAPACIRLTCALVTFLAWPLEHARPGSSAASRSLTASLTSRTCAAATALLMTLIPLARADEVPGYGFESAAQEITQLFWLAETASACGWAQDAEASKFMDFSVPFLTVHLSQTHQQALLSLVTEERYKAGLHRAAREGADQNCASSRWRLGWLSFKAAADEHERDY